MYEEMTLADLGEVSKGWMLRPPGPPSARALARMSPEARAAHTRLHANTRRPPTPREKREIQAMRNSVRTRNAEEAATAQPTPKQAKQGVTPQQAQARRQDINETTNYGVPHKRGIDAPVSYQHRQIAGQAAAQQAQKAVPVARQLGEEVGAGATKSVEAGAREIGEAAGKGVSEATENTRKAVQRAGLGILAGGAAGGATFGAVANLRRRRGKKENVKLDRKTGKLVLA